MTIDEEVWAQFRAAYAAGDADAFLALHAPALIRAGGAGGEVLDFAAYERQIRDFHVLLRRIDGRWRIVADYDSPDEGSAEHF